jgi:hypothetical protein
MIYLFTGQPGHGKTLRAIQMALEYKAQGRNVYAHGVPGLDYAASGFFPLDDPKKWQDLPDGSVVLLDECYTTFPRRAPGAKVPDYVEKMATHRHRGFDFILICQQARQQLDLFLLGLLDSHYHVRRKFGLGGALILEWDQFQENTKNSNIKKPWKYPRDLMRRNLYRSTTQDTTRRRVPWFIWALPGVLCILAVLVWYVVSWFHSPDPVKPVGAVTASSVPLVKPGADMAQLMRGGRRRPDDLVAWFKPRIAGQPWTAPAYDDRPVASDPEIYCIAVDDGRCSCMTEQGTRYALDANICRSIAANGVYNPWRAPERSQDRDRQDRQGTGQPDQSRPSSDAVASSGGGVPWPAGVVPSDYVPPGAPGSWHPHALDGGGTAR